MAWSWVGLQAGMSSVWVARQSGTFRPGCGVSVR